MATPARQGRVVRGVAAMVEGGMRVVMAVVETAVVGVGEGWRGVLQVTAMPPSPEEYVWLLYQTTAES